MLTQTQVTALTAQAAKAAEVSPFDDAGILLTGWQLNDNNEPIYVGQDLSVRGVGIYGQSPSSLVLTGYLKPASLALIVSPDMTADVLNTPAVWTGQYGINSLVDYLNSDILQNISQQALLLGSYVGLINAGYLTGAEDARYTATLIQPAAKYGVTAVIAWIENLLSPEAASAVAIVARQGQYAIDFITAKADQLDLAPDLPGFDFTVERQNIDEVVAEIIGNPKIPVPEFAEYANIVGALVQIGLPAISNEDGVFRFAPGSNQG